MNAPTKRHHSEHEAEEDQSPDPSLRGLNQDATTASGPSNHTEATATQAAELNQSLGPKLHPHKQKLSDLIKAEMIVAGDEMKYKGGKKADYVNCTIIVRKISSRSTLNLTITFLPTPDPASPFATLPPSVQINPVGVKHPTELEDILLSHYGIETANLPAKFRRTWPSFTIIRNGESQGTLADLRTTLGEKRIAGDRETLEKMVITHRRPKQTKAPEAQSTSRVQEEASHDVEQMQARVEQMEQELKDQREALDDSLWLARDLHRLLSDLADNDLLYPLLKQRLVNKIAEIKEKYPPELWAAVTEDDEFN